LVRSQVTAYLKETITQPRRKQALRKTIAMKIALLCAESCG
jgi:hypothetical protein